MSSSETEDDREYRDDYVGCERAVAALRIYAPDLDPAAVTERLEIFPTSSQRRGQVIGRRKPAPIGGWFLSSEGIVVSTDLRRHLDWVLDRIAPRADALRAIGSEPGVIMRISCVWWASEAGGEGLAWSGGGFQLMPRQMRIMADLDLVCDFGLAFYGPADET